MLDYSLDIDTIRLWLTIHLSPLVSDTSILSIPNNRIMRILSEAGMALQNSDQMARGDLGLISDRLRLCLNRRVKLTRHSPWDPHIQELSSLRRLLLK